MDRKGGEVDMANVRKRFGTWLLLAVLLSVTAGCEAPDSGSSVVAPAPVSLAQTHDGKRGDSGESASGGKSSKTDQAEGNPSGAAGQGSSGTADGKSRGEVDLTDVTAMWLINHQAGWIGGDGWIAFSDDGGTDWEVQAYPEETVRQIFALNANHVWAVMENNDLYQSTDGGQIWNKIGRTPNGGFLHFVSPDTGFSGSARTEDGGKTWGESEGPDTTRKPEDLREPLIGWRNPKHQQDLHRHGDWL